MAEPGIHEDQGGSASIDRTTIAAAAARIQAYIRQTPLLEIEHRGRRAELKLECLQVSGTFKARGAFNRLLVNRDRLSHGVAAASGGNHGIAVATACRALGVPAHIFVPGVTPDIKRATLRDLGANLNVVGTYYRDAADACDLFVRRTGALSCHAFDQQETLDGQGTVAREWLAQTRGLDTLLVAVGGGGLIGGIAAWCQGDVRVVAVESEGCPTLQRSLAAGERVSIEVSGIAADSLGASQVGKLMFPIARRHVSAAVLVDDAAITRARRLAWETMRIALEPGGAAALAAWTEGVYVPAPDERVGVLLCGANTAPPADLEAPPVG